MTRRVTFWAVSMSTSLANSRTEEGRARIAAAQLKHGRLTKVARAEAKRRSQIGRAVRAELRTIEKELVVGGLLAKDWRQLFDQ